MKKIILPIIAILLLAGCSSSPEKVEKVDSNPYNFPDRTEMRMQYLEWRTTRDGEKFKWSFDMWARNRYVPHTITPPEKMRAFAEHMRKK